MTRVARSQLAGRRNFLSPLQTEIVSSSGATCRVCGQPIEVNAPSRHRAWGVESAHEACGWFRPDEGHCPLEVRRAGSFVTFYEWRCPSCGLDAVAHREPERDADMRCGRCKLPIVGAPGQLVRPLVVLGVRLPAATRVDVVQLHEAHAMVRHSAIGNFLVPLDALQRAATSGTMGAAKESARG